MIRRYALFVLGMAMLQDAASAQMTPIDPAQWSTPNVMVEGMRNGSRQAGPARSSRRRPDEGAEASARRMCLSVPYFQSKKGAHDPQIVKLKAMCRQARYRMR